MTDFLYPADYRHVVFHHLWDDLSKRQRPIVAHLGWSGRTYCGMSWHFDGGGRRLVAIHETVARAIEAEDCRSCVKAHHAKEALG